MDLSWQIKKILILLVSVIAFGVLGLMFIEGWSVLDALYMSIITLSTVGYKELHPLSFHGEIFIIIYIIVGVGAFLYTITTTVEYLIAGQITGLLERRKMKKLVDSMESHYIICGFGRVGEQIALELAKEGAPFVIIDNNPDSLKRCASLGYPFIEGDASNDKVLCEAGIYRAKGLVTATDSDADNVYIVLSAKSLKNDLYIVARANLEDSEHKLKRAGADKVISPYSIGGRRLASLLLRPGVVEFLDVIMHRGELEMLMEEIVVDKESTLLGNTISESKIKDVTGATILAINKKRAKRLIANPSPQTLIEAGDLLVALGTREQLAKLEGLASGTCNIAN